MASSSFKKPTSKARSAQPARSPSSRSASPPASASAPAAAQGAPAAPTTSFIVDGAPAPDAGDVLGQLVEDPEPTAEEARARDQGTLRFFGALLALAEVLALGWSVRTHAPRTEYLVLAGAGLLLFGLPAFFAWRSLARASEV